MLIKKFDNKILYDKVENKEQINEESLKLYEIKNYIEKKNKNTQVNIEINDFIVEEYLSFDMLKNLLRKENINQILDFNKLRSIFKKTKYSKNDIDELTKIMIEDPRHYDRLIRISEINFSEENIIDLSKKFFIADILKHHKNINKLVNMDLNMDEKTMFFSQLIYNENYLTIDKIKEIFSKEIFIEKKENDTYKYKTGVTKEEIKKLENWFAEIPLDLELVEKYNKILTPKILQTNPNKTEEILKKYFKKLENQVFNDNIPISKLYIKQNIKKNFKSININSVFRKLPKDKDIEEIFFVYLDSILETFKKTIFIDKIEEKTEEEKQKIYQQNLHNIAKKILIKMNFLLKKDFDFYSDLIEKFEKKYNQKINLNFEDIVQLFNENTNEKHFDKLKPFITKPENFQDYDTVKFSIFFVEQYENFRHLIEKTNIPEKFVIDYFPYFTTTMKDENGVDLKFKDYEKFLNYQELPKQNHNFDTNKIIKDFDLSSIMNYLSSLKTKVEANKILNLLREKDKVEKHHFEDSSYYRFLFNNSEYLSSLNLGDAKDLFEKSDIGRTTNNYTLYATLKILNEELELKQINQIKLNKEKFNSKDHNYGLSI